MRASLVAVGIGLCLDLGLGASPAAAQVSPVASTRYLMTGNGHGFALYDADANAVTQFLERPYRFVRAWPGNPHAEGIIRRDLAYDTYFGVRAGDTAGWLGGRRPDEVGYVDQSNMVKTVLSFGGVKTTTYFVEPFGYPGNAMVMFLEVTNTSSTPVPVTAYALHNFRLGNAPNPDDPQAAGEAIEWNGTMAIERGPGGGAMVYAPIGGADQIVCASDPYSGVNGGGGLPSASPSCSGDDIKTAFAKNLGTLAPGASALWGVAILYDDLGAELGTGTGNTPGALASWTAFAGTRTATQLYNDILAEHEAWRKPPLPSISAAELAVWRQSETVLRMATIQESWSESPRRKNAGMMLASLPPGNWHIGWVRDGMYALVALARTGHADLAKQGLDFYLNSDSGKYPELLNNAVGYRISSVRYFGDGEEEADYSGQPTRNIETDGWGMFLWGARVYLERSGDTDWLTQVTRKGDTVYAALREGVAEPMVKNLEENGVAAADSSIWEVHHANRQHFVYTHAAFARGFCDMAAIAAKAGHADDAKRYRDLAIKTRGALDLFADGDGVLASSLERLAAGGAYRDGAAVEALTWDLVPADDPKALGTLAGLSVLSTPVGGYKRVEGSTDPYDNDEWIWLDLRASSAHRRSGQIEKADALLDMVTANAGVNFHLLPELYNVHASSGPLGMYAGSMPMVGYGAGSYLLTLMERANDTEPNDCGPAGSGPGNPDEPDPDDTDGASGCGCQGGRATDAGGLALLVLAICAGTRRRRR